MKDHLTVVIIYSLIAITAVILFTLAVYQYSVRNYNLNRKLRPGFAKRVLFTLASLVLAFITTMLCGSIIIILAKNIFNLSPEPFDAVLGIIILFATIWLALVFYGRMVRKWKPGNRIYPSRIKIKNFRRRLLFFRFMLAVFAVVILSIFIMVIFFPGWIAGKPGIEFYLKIINIFSLIAGFTYLNEQLHFVNENTKAAELTHNGQMVLYLRSFYMDNFPFALPSETAGKKKYRYHVFSPKKALNFDGYFSDTIRQHLGPLYNLGNPSDFLPRKHIYSIYHRHDWFESFTRYVQEARIIIMFIGNTNALARELQYIRETGYLHKFFLFTLPHYEDRHLQRQMRKWLWLKGHEPVNMNEATAFLQSNGIDMDFILPYGAVAAFTREGNISVIAENCRQPMDYIRAVKEHMQTLQKAIECEE